MDFQDITVSPGAFSPRLDEARGRADRKRGQQSVEVVRAKRQEAGQISRLKRTAEQAVMTGLEWQTKVTKGTMHDARN